jgi:hypothetical protein
MRLAVKKARATGQTSPISMQFVQLSLATPAIVLSNKSARFPTTPGQRNL